MVASGGYTTRPQEQEEAATFGCRYDVFLSFRGADTRKNFTDHLYAALKRAGFHTFRDDDEIRRGEDIDTEIQNAIHSTKLSLIVFSKDYASSRWCLDELAMIMKLRRTVGHLVLPVFYDVEPSEVSEQTGNYGGAFAIHEAHFKEEMEMVNGWRVALKEAADLGGMVWRDRYQGQFVQDIVKEVSNKLNRKIFIVPSHFVGRDFDVNDVNLWVQSGSNGGSIAVLYGLGGVGKTTIAKIVYNQNFDKFEGRSFLSNVRERSEQPNGFVRLQEQLLSDILNKNVDRIYYVDAGIMRIKDALCCRKVLIVLDDVENKNQLNAVIRMRSWLCPGSKIIITTRNESLLPAYETCMKLRVEPLESDKSLQLFSWHAFVQTYPPKDYVELSKSIIKYCSGLPLALTVIGSALSGKSVSVWESALQEMKSIPNGEIQKILKISYDSLDNDHHKNLFLDISCFFTEMDEDYVHKILSGLGIDALFGVQNLIDRCLIEIDRYGKISMHRLIKDMGRKLAHEELPECTRIWRDEEAFDMLRENDEGTKRVHGLTLDMNSVTEDRHGRSSPCLDTKAFSKMQSLKYLKLNYVQLNGNYEHFSKKLIWLCWHGFPLNSIPKQFHLENLVVLDMHDSRLVDVWKGKMFLPKLKILDLSYSFWLRRTPDLSGVLSLEKLILKNCIRLVKIHESVSLLISLKDLDLCGCSNLKGLPMGLGQQKVRRLLDKDIVAHISQQIIAAPWTIVSSFCSPREGLGFTASSFPCSLVRLNLGETPISHLPESIINLNTLDWLWLSRCKRLQSLPELPESLHVLCVDDCPSLQQIPQLPPMLFLQDCHQLVEAQDLIKQELIKTAGFHMLTTVKMASLAVLPWIFEMVIQPGIMHIYLAADEITLSLFEEDEHPWLIQEEGPDLMFNIPSPSPTTSHLQIYGLSIWAVCSIPMESDGQFAPYATLINQTKGVTTYCSAYLDVAPFLAESLFEYLQQENNSEIIWVSHWSLGNHDLDYGDEVRVYLNPKPNIEIKKIGIKLVFQEEDLESVVNKDEVASQEEHDTPQSITSEIFSEYYCFLRYLDPDCYYRCGFVYFPNDPV